MHARRTEDKIQQWGVVDLLYFLFSPVGTRRGSRYRCGRSGGCMRRKRSHQEGETRRYYDAQHDMQRGECTQSFAYDTLLLVGGPDGPDK